MTYYFHVDHHRIRTIAIDGADSVAGALKDANAWADRFWGRMSANRIKGNDPKIAALDGAHETMHNQPDWIRFTYREDRYLSHTGDQWTVISHGLPIAAYTDRDTAIELAKKNHIQTKVVWNGEAGDFEENPDGEYEHF